MKFNSIMKSSSYIEELQNTTVSIDYKVYPAMEVRIIPGFESNSRNLKFNWTFLNYTDSELVIQLHFETPEWVSIFEYKEML